MDRDDSKKRQYLRVLGMQQAHPTQSLPYLCAEHYGSFLHGLINKCPKCHRYKQAKDPLCLDCRDGRPVAQPEPPAPIPTPNRPNGLEHSAAWTNGDKGVDEFFVFSRWTTGISISGTRGSSVSDSPSTGTRECSPPPAATPGYSTLKCCLLGRMRRDAKLS